MIDSLVPLFAVGLSLSLPIVWITLNYRRRVRLMELHHAERMAAIERGMDVPPLPSELIAGRSRRSALLPGLVWFFIGLAVLCGYFLGGDDDVPIMGGLVPLGVGLAYLIYYFAEDRRRQKTLQDNTAEARPGVDA